MVMHLRAVPPPPSEHWPDIPAQLEALLLAMLEKHPDDRPTMTEVADRLEVVRGELQRRRVTGPGEAVGLPAEVARRISVRGHAATEAAEAAEWHTRGTRWQYAVGGLALIALAVMFLISRGGDSAAAATAPSAAVRPTGGPPALSATASVPAAPAPAPSKPGTLPPPRAETVAVADAETAATPSASRATPPSAAPRGGRADSPRTGARTRPAPTSSRRAPATPRPSTLDPDGTLDPYR